MKFRGTSIWSKPTWKKFLVKEIIFTFKFGVSSGEAESPLEFTQVGCENVECQLMQSVRSDKN